MSGCPIEIRHATVDKRGVDLSQAPGPAGDNSFEPGGASFTSPQEIDGCQYPLVLNTVGRFNAEPCELFLRLAENFWRVVFENRTQRFGRAVARECTPAGNQFVEYGASTEKVASMIVRPDTCSGLM